MKNSGVVGNAGGAARRMGRMFLKNSQEVVIVAGRWSVIFIKQTFQLFRTLFVDCLAYTHTQYNTFLSRQRPG